MTDPTDEIKLERQSKDSISSELMPTDATVFEAGLGLDLGGFEKRKRKVGVSHVVGCFA